MTLPRSWTCFKFTPVSSPPARGSRDSRLLAETDRPGDYDKGDKLKGWGGARRGYTQ